jgi:hypothetical protein
MMALMISVDGAMDCRLLTKFFLMDGTKFYGMFATDAAIAQRVAIKYMSSIKKHLHLYVTTDFQVL